MDEDYVIKTRLAVEERPLRHFMRQTWQATNDSSLATKCLAELALLESSFMKLTAQIQMSKDQLREFDETEHLIGSQIDSTHVELEALQAELQAAQRRKEKKLECDNYAKKIINKGLRSRKVQKDHIARLEEDIRKLSDERTVLLRNWSQKRDHFATLTAQMDTVRTAIEKDSEIRDPAAKSPGLGTS